MSKAGIDFSSDLLTAVRVVVDYPAAILGVTLALAQVAAPDLAVLIVARISGERTLLRAVGIRFRPWSKEVGARGGIWIWITVVVVFSACNLVSGLLHRALVPDDFAWHVSWSMLALLPVAMFLDAGALMEENGWRGFALPSCFGPEAGPWVQEQEPLWARNGGHGTIFTDPSGNKRLSSTGRMRLRTSGSNSSTSSSPKTGSGYWTMAAASGEPPVMPLLVP